MEGSPLACPALSHAVASLRVACTESLRPRRVVVEASHVFPVQQSPTHGCSKWPHVCSSSSDQKIAANCSGAR
eukprot:722559-Rhodomonas_salina.2